MKWHSLIMFDLGTEPGTVFLMWKEKTGFTLVKYKGNGQLEEQGSGKLYSLENNPFIGYTNLVAP